MTSAVPAAAHGQPDEGFPGGSGDATDRRLPVGDGKGGGIETVPRDRCWRVDGCVPAGVGRGRGKERVGTGTSTGATSGPGDGVCIGVGVGVGSGAPGSRNRSGSTPGIAWGVGTGVGDACSCAAASTATKHAARTTASAGNFPDCTVHC